MYFPYTVKCELEGTRGSVTLFKPEGAKTGAPRPLNDFPVFRSLEAAKAVESR